MRIIEIIALENGAHRNQNYSGCIPEGYALIRNDVELKNYPFGTFEVEKAEVDKIGFVTCMKENTWSPLSFSEPKIIFASIKRKEVYNTEKIIPWEDTLITVTEASQLWQYYAAEGNLKADILSDLISEAKQTIRQLYPD